MTRLDYHKLVVTSVKVMIFEKMEKKLKSFVLRDWLNWFETKIRKNIDFGFAIKVIT